MENKSPLVGLVLDSIVVDGERAVALTPRARKQKPLFTTAEAVCVEAGICPDSPRYSGLHDHCQYSRTC
jgi:hypothetical protein